MSGHSPLILITPLGMEPPISLLPHILFYQTNLFYHPYVGANREERDGLLIRSTSMDKLKIFDVKGRLSRKKSSRKKKGTSKSVGDAASIADLSSVTSSVSSMEREDRSFDVRRVRDSIPRTRHAPKFSSNDEIARQYCINNDGMKRQQQDGGNNNAVRFKGRRTPRTCRGLEGRGLINGVYRAGGRKRADGLFEQEFVDFI